MGAVVRQERPAARNVGKLPRGHPPAPGAAIGAVPDAPVSTYAFAADPNTGTTLAQGADPAPTYMLDRDAMAAVPHVSDVLDKMGTGSGSWMGYSVISPVTGEVENKRTWLMMHDGLAFGSGHYSSD